MTPDQIAYERRMCKSEGREIAKTSTPTHDPHRLHWVLTRKPHPIFYSSLVYDDMLKCGVDRLASRHAGMRSLLPRHPERNMEAHHAQATATRRSGDLGISSVSETRKLAAILVADIVGYSRLAGADEDRILE